MNKVLIASLLVVLMIVFISGCTSTQTSESNITNQKEATDTLVNVSTGVDDVSSTLDDIDSLLG